MRRVSVAINVAGQQVLEPGFAATVVRALGDGGLPPHRLEIELTERTLLRYPASALRTLEELARFGCTRLRGYFYGRPMVAGEALALACRQSPPLPGDAPDQVAA